MTNLNYFDNPGRVYVKVFFSLRSFWFLIEVTPYVKLGPYTTQHIFVRTPATIILYSLTINSLDPE